MADNNTATREQLYETISSLHGGYWQYRFVDHAYLYNLYFPPARFFEQLTHQIRELVLSYPVAQSALAEMVGKIIDQPADYIVVGNGASELIKIVSGHLAKTLIVPVPSFNEYTNAAPAERVVEFHLDLPSFQLDVDKFAEEAIRCGADVAVVVSPNNPTSLLVPRADLIRLLVKLAKHGCILIVDESFVDFTEDPEQLSLESEIESYPNLVIFKSMSKAYGICGLRIGYMLTANKTFAERVRQGVSIWNLNGLAEAFLRSAPEYREEFKISCAKVRSDRDLLFKELCTIEGLLAYKPDANYIFCRLPDHSPTGPDVTRQLFVEHNIYIKHCHGKTMADSDRYLRIASRTPEENRTLVEVLGQIVATRKHQSLAPPA